MNSQILPHTLPLLFALCNKQAFITGGSVGVLVTACLVTDMTICMDMASSEQLTDEQLPHHSQVEIALIERNLIVPGWACL
jgi:hypothetical protein